MGVLDRLFAKQMEQARNEAVASFRTELVDMTKATSANAMALPTMPTGTKMRYQFDPAYMNRGTQTKTKPGASVSFDTLRRFATVHEISRACINFRKRQMTSLEYKIVTTDKTDTNDYTKTSTEIKKWFEQLGGLGSGYRKFMNRCIEDLMVLDAIAIEKQRSYNGGIANLIPYDASTIRLLVDNSGGTPAPPDPAYRQYIRGQQTAEFTTDELIYDMLNPRTDTPYGLAPLESLIITVTSSLKSNSYNLGYLTDGNIPEGIFNVPQEWTPQMIQDYQTNWDAMLAGDDTATRRLIFVPGGGGGYVPTKKPTDMAFEQFNEWLLKVTCAVFDVQPTDIGFAPKGGLGGKGFSEEQGEISEKKGIKPLANFFEEIFSRIIADEFGCPELSFEFDGLDDKDVKLIADTNSVMIMSGQRTINEIRVDEGLDPVEGGDIAIVAGQFSQIGIDPIVTDVNGNNVIDTETVTAPPEPPAKDAPVEPAKKSYDAETAHVQLVTELRTFRKYALNRLKAGRTIKPFESDILPQVAVKEINRRLIDEVQNEDEAKALFKEFMQDYQIDFLANVHQLKEQIAKGIL